MFKRMRRVVYILLIILSASWPRIFRLRVAYMSGFFGIIFVVGILTALGTLTLLLVTVKYYWGERGTPPLKREERRHMREEELRFRAKQIEYSKRNPIVTRNGNFWDNGKVYK